MRARRGTFLKLSIPHDEPLAARDVLYASVVGLIAVALYVATLQPDLGGPEDTPKFQFVGYVLGTAHPPGYPLYVLLSHLFVKVPIGTIAYRANLFSAVLAAVACGLAYLIGRQLGSARGPALCAAFGLATGASFWRSAVFAEVYSLAAVMVVMTVGLLLAWGAGGGAGRLLAAVAAFSLGLGNHLTIVGLLPAAVLYVLLRNRRVLTARVSAAALIVLLLGVSQYGFIVLRTYQGAPYLESSARSLSELSRVVTAERFAEDRFAFSPSVVMTAHLPAVASVIGRELGAAGVLLLIAGLAAALHRRNGGAAFLVGAAGGMLAMVVSLEGDRRGFITPVVALLWPLAGLGIDAMRRVLGSRRIVRLNVGTIALAVAAAVPLAHLAANYKDADQSEQTSDAQFLRSVYRQLPDGAGIVSEGYWYHMMLHYLMLTGEEGANRGIARIDFSSGAVRAAARAGRRVFGFAGSATFLGAEGLQFDRAAVAGPPLTEWLRGLPRGSVIVGATAYAPVPFEVDRRDVPVGRPRSFTAFALIAGQSGVARRDGDVATSLAVEPGALESPLPAFPGTVLASADERRARVELGGRTIAEVDSGLALAVFTPDGAFRRALDFPAGEPQQVPFQEAFYELKGETPCVEVTRDTWSDVAPALSTGSWLATLAQPGSVVIESAFSESRGVRALSRGLFGGGIARGVGQTHGAEGGDVLFTELTRPDSRRPVFRLTLDSPPMVARARVRAGGAQSSVTLCAHLPHPLFPVGVNHAVLRPDFESEAYYGAGWGGAERTATGHVRHGENYATLLLPLEAGYAYRVALDVGAAAGTWIDVISNGTAAGACELRNGALCEVTLAPGVVRDGINTLALSVTRAPESGQPGIGLIFQGARILRRSLEHDHEARGF